MLKSKSNAIAVLIILAAAALAGFSVKDESLTSDELAHIPAGYSYLTKRDARLNPEHPPLLKDLAALPLLFFKNIKIDTAHPSWAKDVNGQWSFGANFMYELANNADAIALAARLAMLIVFILLCWFVYRWAKEKYGANAALLALVLTALSPNILAHARYVTTDVGAAFGFIVASYYFVKFIYRPSAKNIIKAGLAFGLAQLLKFSLILLIPLFVFTGLVYWLFSKRISFTRIILSLAAIFTIGYLLVWPIYQFHVWNYPPERQRHDTEFILSSFPFKPVAEAAVWMSDKPLARPYAQYMLGLLMVFQRTGGGNTTYYLGEVASEAWKSYFPVVYLLKEPLPILILVALALLVAVIRAAGSGWNRWFSRTGRWTADNFTEFVWMSFIVLYWLTSIMGNLNIGLRHTLPTFPFIYMMTAGQIQKWIKKSAGLTVKIGLGALVAVMLFWLILETMTAYPYYLAYFNEFAGGPSGGYKYAVDSNLDWGQDLRRLQKFMKENNIEKIKLDYFGGGRPEYYLGDKYEYLKSRDPNQRHGWLAVSATFLQNGRGLPVKGYNQDTTFYNWLNPYEPEAKIGYSIFVYKLAP